MLMRGCGMDIEAGMPAFIPAAAPIPPIPKPGTEWPMGAIPARGTMVTGWAGSEPRLMGSGMPPKPAGMGLMRIWLRVGGAGWLTWKGLAWAAGAAPPAKMQMQKCDHLKFHTVITVVLSNTSKLYFFYLERI